MGTLASFKNVFLAPLAKVRIAGLESRLPSSNASSTVSLHDNHNIEIKTVSELGPISSLVETDCYLFVPRNFELPGYGKDELIRDFRSRMRLSLPVSGEQGSAAFEKALGDLLHGIAVYEQNVTSPGFTIGAREIVAGSDKDTAAEMILEAAKDLSAVMAETLKHRANHHTRELFLSQSKLTVASAATLGLDHLSAQVAETSALITRVRSAIESNSENQAAILAFLDEYISYMYVHYLSTIRHELEGVKAPEGTEDDLGYIQASNRIESQLDELQEKEGRHRSRFGTRAIEDENELDRERRLVRLSHLKKFFQSKTFIDISRQRVAKKVGGSIATIGTAAAAIVAALVEHYSRPEVGNVARHSLIVLSFGVIFYVFRDRLKDWVKNHFQEKALQFLPDFEQQLVVKNRRIGTVKEWFRVVKSKDLPADILKQRQEGSANEMERRLPEDVFHCRRIQEILSSVPAEGATGREEMITARALHENTRVNLERYLKHMDDPFKNFADLDTNGRFQHSRSHRVYHFYLCVKTRFGAHDPSTKVLRLHKQNVGLSDSTEHGCQTLFYRIVLDKNGVVRLENLA